MKQQFPFIFGKSADLINFTDREEESWHPEMNFKSLINTIRISPTSFWKKHEKKVIIRLFNVFLSSVKKYY